MVESDRDSFITVEDIKWRPEVAKERPTWRMQFRLVRRNRTLRRELWKQPRVGRDSVGRVLGNDRYGGAQVAGRLLYLVDEQKNEYAYSKMAEGKPLSVRIAAWLRSHGLPTLGLGWRWDLWLEVLLWEFGQWSDHLHEIQEVYSYSKTVDTLLEKLPLTPGKPRTWHPTFHTYGGHPKRTDEEAAIAFRWLLCHGVHLNDQEWQLFVYHGGGHLWGSDG